MRNMESARSAEVGASIRQIRKSRGMTQFQLAEVLGKTLRTVQKYETGDIELTISGLEQVADALNVEPMDLLGYNSSKWGAGEKVPCTFAAWRAGYTEGFKEGVTFVSSRKARI